MRRDKPGVLVADDLVSMVRSYADDPELALIPNDPVREARLNTSRYGVAAGSVAVDAVIEALVTVAAELRRRFASESGPAVFYAWYDEQAGQLRCSLASGSAQALPFGGTYRLTDDPTELLMLASVDPQPGLVPWTELTVDAGDPPERPAADPFPVWAVAVR